MHKTLFSDLKMKSLKNSRKRLGFTLIELMVVVLIIAVLAALIVPRVVQRQDDAKYAAAKSQIARLSSILQQFRLDCDRFPTNEEGLQSLVQSPSDATGWKGPYLDRIPLDPWEQEYVYQFPGATGEESFYLASGGKDKQPSSDDDFTNQDL
jgi:general secretion pathway protein G